MSSEEPSPEYSQWDEALGPFYAQSALERSGLAQRGDLITITTAEGYTIYPHAQFDEADDGSLRPREEALNIWNIMLKPAIDNGIIDEYSAAALFLFNKGEREVTLVELFSNPDADPTEKVNAIFSIQNTLSHMMR